MNEAVQRFAEDLVDCGARPECVAHVVALYQRALTAPSAHGWEAFYRATFWALDDLSRSRTFAVRSPAALDSLLTLIGDDLGVLLFGDDAGAELRDRLCCNLLAG